MAWRVGTSNEAPFDSYRLEFVDSDKPLKQWFMDHPPHAATTVDSRWDNGSTIPAHFVPKHVKTNKSTLYDWHSVGGAPLVSDRFRQAFESEGPGQQQFFQVDVTDTSGCVIEEPWFIFNVNNIIDSIIEARSNLHADRAGVGTWYYVEKQGGWRVAMDAKTHRGLTAWVELHYPRQFVSDRVAERLTALSLKGFRLYDHCIEV